VNFGFSPEQQQLRESIRDYLGAEAPVSFARTMMEDPTGTTEAAWRALVELGWLGLAMPEELGGSGLGTLELVLLLEELGRVVHPGPLSMLVSLAIPTLLAVGDDDQKRRRCAALVGGDLRMAVAVAEERGRWDGSGIAMTATHTNGGFELSGTKLFVPDARSADEIVVVARLDGGLGYFAVPTATPGLTVTPMRTVDETRKLDVAELASVQVGEDLLLGHQAYEPSSLDAIVDVAKTALAAEACGAAEAALALSVDYVQVREQFGRAIATFQAIQHRLADMKVDLENARSLVYYAAWAIDNDAPDRRLAAAMAKAYASDACTRIAADAIQVHGGIAFTWEHDMHLYFKRLKADEVTYGDATENRELVATLLEL